jgi:hypothetical protein
MVLDSVRNNKELLNMLSPKMSVARPSMVSPKEALGTAQKGHQTTLSPQAMNQTQPIISH